MGNTFKILSFLIAFFWSLQLQAERQSLSWQIEESDQVEARLSFENAVHDPATGLPHVVLRYENRIIDNAYLVNPQYQPISINESELIQNVGFADEAELKVEFYYTEEREISYIDLLPFRINPNTGKIEKLLSWELLIIDALDHSALHQRSGQTLKAANNSVLANGNWFKLGVVVSVVYLLN